MPQTILEGVESLRIVRADGNLTILGAQALTIDSSDAPAVVRIGGTAEVSIRSNATIGVPAGVAIEIEDVAGNLEVTDIVAPLVLLNVRGNLRTLRIGALAIRDSVSGNVWIKQASAVEGYKIRGSLEVESARSVSMGRVAGEFECRDVDGEVAIEKISGGARLASIRGPFIARLIGGNLEVEDAVDAEAGVVGGKVRASRLSGALRAGKIGGKLAADGIGADVTVGYVGGNARIARVGGAVSLEEVGGAVDLEGPYPAAQSWLVRGRGRVNVQVDADASMELDASAGWGRIRTRGVEAAGLKWVGRNHVHGTIGREAAGGGPMKLTVETRGADVIVATAEAREREFSGRGYRSRIGRAFAAPFEDLAGELGEDIPAFVRTVLDATGKFVGEAGDFPGGIVREVTRDVKRSVSDGLREVERALADIEESVPSDVGDKLSKLGHEIADLVTQALKGGTREARDEMRERVRDAAREMRDTIRQAAHDVRKAARDRGDQPEASPKPQSAAAAPTSGATEKLNREDAIMDILAAVKDGRLEPDEADDLIKAWMEVQGAGAHH